MSSNNQQQPSGLAANAGRRPLWAWIAGAALLCSACTDRPPELAAADYTRLAASPRCLPGERAGRPGATDDLHTARKIRYSVRTPSNYDAAVAHPLLMVYAPAGSSRFKSERFAGLTREATAAGFVVAYADARRLSIDVILELGAIPRSVANEWCIDEQRIFLTGHSDGGTVSNALEFLDRTRDLPAAIAPSAAGIRGKDLESYTCPARPLPVMVMHSADDSLFKGYGAEAAAWWAKCNRCDAERGPELKNGCAAYSGCAAGATTLYCEGRGPHGNWPGLNQVMLDFFLRAARP